MPIQSVALSNTFNQFRTTTNDIITEVNRLSDGTANLVINTITANTIIGSGTNLSVAGNTGTDTISLGSETLSFVGTNNISTVVTANTVRITLNNSGVTSGVYGSASRVPQLTIDAQGRITSAANVTVAGVSSFNYYSGNTNFVINTADGNTFTTTLSSIPNSVTTASSSNGASTIVARDTGGSASFNVVTAASYSGAGVSSSNGASTVVLRDSGGSTTVNQLNATTLTVSGNTTISGNLTVLGTTTTISANNLAVKDNLIYLNDGSTNTNVDLGFTGNYNDGTYRHAGLFRDADDGVWKFFDKYVPEPNLNIDTTNSTFTFAQLKANNVFSTGVFDGSGANLSALNASNVTSGTIATARLGSGTANSLTFLRGDQTYAVIPTASANGAGTIVSRDSGGSVAFNIVTATTFSGAYTGNGSGLSALNASNVTSGTIATARLGSGTANSLTFLRGDQTYAVIPTASANGAGTIVSRDSGGSASFNIVTATTFSGSGASLTNIPNSATTAASANGASTIVARDSGGSFVGNRVTAVTFIGSGAEITTLNASNVTSGTIATARLGSGTANSLTFLRGDQTYAVIPTASANGAGTIVSRDSGGSAAFNVITAASFDGAGVSSSNGSLTVVERDSGGSFVGNIITATRFIGDGASLTGLTANNFSVLPFDPAVTHFYSYNFS